MVKQDGMRVVARVSGAVAEVHYVLGKDFDLARGLKGYARLVAFDCMPSLCGTTDRSWSEYDSVTGISTKLCANCASVANRKAYLVRRM